jgi:hypothetical protein
MVRSVQEVVMFAEMHIMYSLTVAAKLWFSGTDWSCMWWINQILLHFYSVECCVGCCLLMMCIIREFCIFFEDVLLYENITLGLYIKFWNYYIRNSHTCQVIIITSICRNYMNITVSVIWTAHTTFDGSSSVGSQAEGMGDTVNWHHKPSYLCLRNVSRQNMHLMASAKC